MDTRHTISHEALSAYWQKLSATSQSDARRQVTQRQQRLEQTWRQSMGTDVLHFVQISLHGIQVDPVTDAVLNASKGVTGDIRRWDISESDVLQNKPGFIFVFIVFPRRLHFHGNQCDVTPQYPRARFRVHDPKDFSSPIDVDKVVFSASKTFTLEGIEHYVRNTMGYEITAPHAQVQLDEWYRDLTQNIVSEFESGTFQRQVE
jgi:hypothetical protein